MLTTGVRTPAGIKVFGPDLAGIEELSLKLEGVLRDVAGTRSAFAERQTGREYIDIVPNREAIARYGLTVRDIHELVEAAVGGMPVSTVIDGRARYSVNVRYAADFRNDVDALRALLVPIPPPQPLLIADGALAGAGRAPAAASAMAPTAGMGEMSATPARAAAASNGPAMPMAAAAERNGAGEQDWLQTGPAVPLRMLADVNIVTGPAMIKDENGVLVGYVYADIDGAQRDLGSWVEDAKQWTGQYEFMAQMEERLRLIVPLTLLLVIALVKLSLRGWVQTALVLACLPFALAGSVWLLALLDYNLSTAVWVGLIAVGGVAAQTGIVAVVYLDQALDDRRAQGTLRTIEDVDQAVVDGAAKSLRPMVMTTATTVLGLLPLLLESGVGADLSARTAAPVVGGLASCLFLTLLVLPAVYAIWRRRELLGAARVDATRSHVPRI
jgi:Cu(I)/Ag(I) efflux system membrane protein CusA/SilA